MCLCHSSACYRPLSYRTLDAAEPFPGLPRLPGLPSSLYPYPSCPSSLYPYPSSPSSLYPYSSFTCPFSLPHTSQILPLICSYLLSLHLCGVQTSGPSTLAAIITIFIHPLICAGFSRLRFYHCSYYAQQLRLKRKLKAMLTDSVAVSSQGAPWIANPLLLSAMGPAEESS